MEPDPLPKKTHARTVAVIDDDSRVRESLCNLLASYGYKAEAYASAELFLANDGVAKSVCVVADVQLRDKKMSGLTLLETIRSNHSDLPVIIITGKPSTRTETFYLEKGASGFFRKPVDGQALMTLVDHLST